MPGVQNPHWLAPRATNRGPTGRRILGIHPSRVVTSLPAMRRMGVTHETRELRPPRPCSSRIGPGGCSHPSPSDSRVRHGARRGARSHVDGHVDTVEDELDGTDAHGLSCRWVTESRRHKRSRWARASGNPTHRSARAQLNEEPQPQVRGGVGIGDVEARTLEAVTEVEGRPGEQLGAGSVD